MPRTPFVFDEKVDIGSIVSSLAFDDPSGKEIPVKDLTEPISIFLTFNRETQRQTNITGSLTPRVKTKVYKISRDAHCSFYIEVKCTGLNETNGTLKLLWRTGSPPTTERFNFLWEVASCNETLKEFISGSKLGNSENLFLGLQFMTGNVSASTSDINELAYHVSVSGVGCYYWDEDREQWSLDGCEVSCHSFIHSFIHSFTYSLIHSFCHSLVQAVSLDVFPA